MANAGKGACPGARLGGQLVGRWRGPGRACPVWLHHARLHAAASQLITAGRRRFTVCASGPPRVSPAGRSTAALPSS